MPDFDYAGTALSFQTVQYSHHTCECGLEHEYLDYITQTRELDEGKYQKVLLLLMADAPM